MENEDPKKDELNEPEFAVKKRLKIFHSFEEENQAAIDDMAALTKKEIFINLRKLINIAYGFHGYDPNNLPIKHSIHIDRK